jgi:transposase-like protein
LTKVRKESPPITIVSITVWEDSVDSYVEAKREVAVKRPKKCPACGGKDIILWSGYWRYVVVDEIAKQLFIHRALCKTCKKTHSLIPWFILPRRAYLASTIGYSLWLKVVNNQSIRKIAKDLRVNRSTVLGWIRRYYFQVDNIYERCLFLIHSVKAHPPPVSDVKSSAILMLFKLFSLTRFSNTHSYFLNYVSLLLRGRFLTNTTSPLRSRPHS